jgi:hypothetical protein
LGHNGVVNIKSRLHMGNHTIDMAICPIKKVFVSRLGTAFEPAKF